MKCLNPPVAESHRVFCEEKAEMTCPFYRSETTLCAASLSGLVIGKQKQAVLCGSDDYDNCPLFLAKTLRMRAIDTPLKLK